jgi:hypothetical protein
LRDYILYFVYFVYYDLVNNNVFKGNLVSFIMGDLFGKTMNEKFGKSLDNYEREGYVVYDPTEQFNDVNEMYFHIDEAEVGRETIVLKGNEYSFIPTGKKRIPLAFVKGEYKEEVPISQIMSFSNYLRK